MTKGGYLVDYDPFLTEVAETGCFNVHFRHHVGVICINDDMNALTLSHFDSKAHGKPMAWKLEAPRGMIPCQQAQGPAGYYAWQNLGSGVTRVWYARPARLSRGAAGLLITSKRLLD
ncbi:hypothetical protein FVEG_04010 [Fusarium verticillioides 7600]|uniref:Uncharacterized protein n=1 Tax=Gibberella moniliformis (strain M3125 / FGSC 7600) TaxID=334819 RepID=W7LU16_GIBM7|nr:hypothetical protein FVEG_04010 [Fusarium verticillioides 7600]EWG42066.1 hypothetical protein FVEG_04010 [Fusarium verticillioides 7600]